jgi:hypothetical protein
VIYRALTQEQRQAIARKAAAARVGQGKNEALGDKLETPL